MKKWIIVCFLGMFLLSTSLSVFSGEPVRIEVLYMNHGPLRPTLRELDKLFTGYGDRIAVMCMILTVRRGNGLRRKRG